MASVAVGVGAYEGERVGGRKEGQGRYTFPSGTVYNGLFLDGQFHGEGSLTFPGGGTFHATWHKGKMVAGSYDFKDGLSYSQKDWEYCSAGDRRFFSEHVDGLRPAGDAQVTNEHPPPRLPSGMYDVGDGYLDPQEGKVYSFSHRVLRVASDEEKRWARSKCRVGTA